MFVNSPEYSTGQSSFTLENHQLIKGTTAHYYWHKLYNHIKNRLAPHFLTESKTNEMTTWITLTWSSNTFAKLWLAKKELGEIK